MVDEFVKQSESSYSVSPLLTILIPTHNRQDYAASTVDALARSLLRSEIIVCDTSVEDTLSSKIATWIDTGRVRLIRPKSDKQLTVVDNFREAARHATGEFLIFIGDDDFVHESAEDIASWALHETIDAVRCTFPASYYWPDFSSKYFGSGYSSKLAILPFTSAVRPLKSITEYTEAIDNLGAGVLRMPRAYLGMVSRKLIGRIESNHGSLFGGVSPDAYSAALIAAEASNCVEVDFPFIVPGSSGASTSGQSAQGGHKGKLRDNSHIGPFQDLVWDARIPEFYSVPTVWAYSLLKAAEKLGDAQKLNFPRLYAKCFMMHPSYFSEILNAMRSYANIHGYFQMILYFSRECSRELWQQVLRIIRRIRHPKATAAANVIPNISNCQEASKALSIYIASCQQAKPVWFLTDI